MVDDLQAMVKQEQQKESVLEFTMLKTGVWDTGGKDILSRPPEDLVSRQTDVNSRDVYSQNVSSIFARKEEHTIEKHRERDQSIES